MHTPPLTNRQSEILRFIAKFTNEKGFPPTLRGICKATGMASPHAAFSHVRALIKKGVLEHTPKISRSLRIVKEVAHAS